MNNNERILNDLGDYGDAEFTVSRMPLYIDGGSQAYDTNDGGIFITLLIVM